MAHIKPTSSEQSPQPFDSEPVSSCQKLVCALLIIAAIGVLIVGLVSLGDQQGWWSASTLLRLGQIPAILLIAGGGLTALVCSIVLVCCRSSQTHILSEDFETITTHSDILIESSTHYLQGPIDPLTNMKLGLQVWVAQGSVDEKHGRETCAQRIIDCYQNSSVELNLRDLELRSLPPEIGQLSSLTKLDLIKNQLTSLPSEIWQLSSLISLHLHYNQLKDIPGGIGQLSCLVELNLDANELTSLPPEIGQLSRLQFLNLKFNQLTCLPKEAGQLSNLVSLDMDQNRLTSVPPEIWQLSRLIYLNLSTNQLTLIPREIGQLSSLETLYLNRNQLTSLPSEIWQLYSLTTFELCKNRLTSIPREINQLSNLNTLNLEDNRVSCLSPEIGQLFNLKYLRLEHNQFSCLPSEIGQLSNLIILDLGRNQLTSLPSEISNLTSLSSLSLDHNQLASFPFEICQLFSLTHLYIGNNRMASLPEEILQMQSNLEIRIEENPLSLRVIQNLQQLMNAPSYNGPRIHFSIAEVRATNNRTLDELMQELAQAAGQPPIALRNLIDHSENIRKWLVRLSAIGDYKNKRKEFAGMIYQAIALAEAEADFRDSFLGCIDEAESTCGDRMALSVLRLDILYKIAKSVKEGNLKELAYLLGHGSWALSELETIARNKVPTLRLVDEIEVYLAYPVKLKAALKLPINLDSMLYFACSSVTTQDLSTAETLVRGFLSDQEGYLGYLAKNATWQKALAQYRKEEYAIIAHKRESSDSEKEFVADLIKLTQKTLQEVGMPPFLPQKAIQAA